MEKPVWPVTGIEVKGFKTMKTKIKIEKDLNSPRMWRGFRFGGFDTDSPVKAFWLVRSGRKAVLLTVRKGGVVGRLRRTSR